MQFRGLRLDALRRRRAAPPVRAARLLELPGGAVAAAPARGAPRAVVHFLGGAFAGAAPLEFYGGLVEQLADAAGVTVVAVPYPISFKHELAARSTHAAFLAALAALRAAPATAWAAPPAAPLVAIGHSQGALLHALAGATCAPQTSTYAASALVSFNNKSVGDAVPLRLGPAGAAIDALRAALGGAPLAARADAAAGAAAAALEAGARAAGAAEPELRLLRALRPALAQVGGVFDELGDGAVNFEPSPAGTRALLSSYAVPSTLLVRFADDGIDETPELAALLRGAGARVAELALPGTHVTPLGGAPPAPPRGGAFSPADALAAALDAAAAADRCRLGARLAAWLAATV
jgi:hypothetical protein